MGASNEISEILDRLVKTKSVPYAIVALPACSGALNSQTFPFTPQVSLLGNSG